jgi:hypothetical protein
VKSVSFSEVHQGRRIWTAHVAVDASRCAAKVGHFEIDFLRLREDAPDLRFAESFTWVPGEIDATTVFAADEAVQEYAVRVASCPCRE